MELINLEVSKWGISLQTYFGDVFIYYRALLFAVGVIVILRSIKLIRKVGKK